MFLTVSFATHLAPAEGLDDTLTIDQILNADIEQLMKVKVFSVTGTYQDWFATPAAMYVITGEDVRRTGHRTLADALRLAPGVFVGHINSQAMSVGIRGFNGGLANKTLVLIDGRSVYDPLFSGTFWNVQDVLLEDLERIEVIRGPGATLWGENAVNGVINVITKSARDTQGWYLSAGGGTYHRFFTDARYGTQISENSWLRVYGKWFNRDGTVTSAGIDAQDDWNMGRGGFRFDSEGDDGIKFTLQGDVYDSTQIGERIAVLPVPGEHMVFTQDIRNGRNSGGNLLFHVGKDGDPLRGWSWQGYYDRTERVTNGGFRVQRDTLDTEFRHWFPLGDHHNLQWGVGARSSTDQTVPGPNTFLDPRSETLNRVSGFVQDTITLQPDRWFLMIGSKLGYHPYVDFEVQPSGRLWWTPNERQTWWAAISRPVRVPSRIERDGTLVFTYADTGLLAGDPPSGVIVPIGVTGADVRAETLLAYEAGHRWRITNDLTLDVAGFYNDYDQLIYVAPTILGPFNNDGTAESYGGELALTWRVSDNWKLESSYSYIDIQVHGPVFTDDEGNTPHHMAKFRSYYNITDNLEFNSALYYIDNVPSLNIEHYIRLDLGLTWRINPNFEIAVWGVNLLDGQHQEFSALEAERSAYLQATLRF